MKFSSILYDNIKISINSIKSNLLRTTLTIFIIAFGIMALVGILTAVDSIKATITSEFTNMGANTVSIRKNDREIKDKNGKIIDSPPIKYQEAVRFKNEYKLPAKVSISVYVSWTATLKNSNLKTDPNISVIGADENYLLTSGREIKYGRNFTQTDILSGENLIIIGSDIQKRLFPNKENPCDKLINIGSSKYRIIGVLKEKGSSFVGDGDKIGLISITNARQYFTGKKSYVINIIPDNPQHIDYAVEEAEGLFRTIRNLKSHEPSNFIINKSDNIVNMLLENISIVTAGATIIGLITLLGASVGLMNIMLVSVAERTREIGIRKAIGAKSSTIKQQFLFESVFIGQLGGILGIILGIVAGNLISLITGGSFIIPWVWILLAVVLCFLVSIGSGYIPAQKASKLDPIEALRYE